MEGFMRGEEGLKLLHRENKGKRSIYFFPIHWDKEKYYVHIAFSAYSQVIAELHENKLKIYQFKGISAEPLEDLKHTLKEYLKGEGDDLKASSRADMLLGSVVSLASGGLILLGLINIIVPDALLLVDEILTLMAGYAGIRFGSKKMFRSFVDKKLFGNLEQKIEKLKPIDDPLLNRLHQAISEFRRTGDLLALSTEEEQVEDSLSRSLNSVTVTPKEIREIMAAHQISVTDLILLTVNLIKVFRLREISLQKNTDSTISDKLEEEVKIRTGATDAALFTYKYFLRSVEQLFPGELTAALEE